MCTLCVLFYLSDTNTPHRQYYLQLPLCIAPRPSRANGGAPVPAPMVALPFRRLLTFVRPTPVPPSPHQFHLSHSSLVFSNQPANGGAPVLSLLFRRLPTSVHPSPTNAPSSPSFPSFPSVPSVPSVPPLHPAIIIRYDPVPVPEISSDTDISSDTAIQRLQRSDPIQPANTVRQSYCY